MAPSPAEADLPARRGLITLAVMITTVMVVLDMTIVNVALPHMMATLGATSQQVTWVLTAYLVSQAVFVSLTGFLSRRYGQRRVVLVCTAGFVITSALCGQAGNLAEMVLFRILQGALGAPLMPLSQAVMVQSFGREQRGQAMAIWGMGIMVAPVLGPTLGGYITDHLDWRWVFYINGPVGLVSWLLSVISVPDTPTQRGAIDWPGMLMMAIGVGSLQLMLDRGNVEDWFTSDLIVSLAVAAVIGGVGFIYYCWRHPDPVVNLRLFRDRNLATASLLMAAFGLGLFGTITIQPIMLENLLGYPAALTGEVMAPRAIASALGMMVVGRVIRHVDARYLITTGIILASFGGWQMTRYNLSLDMFWIVWPAAIQGLGIGMIFVPLSTLAYDTLPKRDMAEAAGLYNLTRTIGSSIGISVLATTLSRRGQYHWQTLGGNIQADNPTVYLWLQDHGLSLADPGAAASLARELGRQASMLAFIDAYLLVSWSFIVMAPVVWWLRRAGHGQPAAPPPSEA